MEHLQGVHFFAARNEFQRFVDNRTDRYGSTAARIAVELGQDDTVEIEPVVELLGGIDGILTRHRVDDEERLARLDGRLDRRYLLHHRLVDGQTAGRIDYDDII